MTTRDGVEESAVEEALAFIEHHMATFPPFTNADEDAALATIRAELAAMREVVEAAKASCDRCRANSGGKCEWPPEVCNLCAAIARYEEGRS